MEKPVHLLRVDELVSNPVWEFVNDDSREEMLVRPVEHLPVGNLEGRLVGTQVRLLDGEQRWALLGNVDVHDPVWTKHVVTVSIEREGTWFMMSRYHDFDHAERGPSALAAFLGRSAADVFPMTYDLRRYVIGDVAALVGKLTDSPPEDKMTRASIVAAAARRRR